MGYREIKRKYYKQNDPSLLLQLLGATTGNTYLNWIDTSMYMTNAVVPYEVHAPSFADGWYNFNASTFDYMIVPDSDRFTFVNNTNDLPFTVEYLIRFDTVGHAILISKSGQKQEWQTDYYNGAFRMTIFSDDDVNVFIGAQKSFTPTPSTEYLLKFSYDDSGTKEGISISINDVAQTGLNRYSNGTYIKMVNTDEPLSLTGSYGLYLNGGLKDIKIYNKVV